MSIRSLLEADVAAFRVLRLEGLRLHPESFGASLAEEERLGDAAFAQRIPQSPPDAIFGAFLSDAPAQPRLAGILGFHVQKHEKQRHKAYLWGMFVQAAYRRQGIGARLLDHAIDHARHSAGIEIIQLTVAVGNQGALALYSAAGFVRYGLERHALKLDGARYSDEELMALDLSAGR